MGAGRTMNPWWTVVGAVLGLTVGNGPTMQFTFGVLLKPVAAGLGVERGTVSVALLVGLVLTGVATPLVGRAVDRFGIRAVGAPAILLFGLSMAAIGLLARGPTSFVLLYGVAGLMAAGQTPLTYAKAIAARFDENRGLALGVSMAGVGLGTALLPKFTQGLLGAGIGFRQVYVALGVLTVVVALPAMLWLVQPGRQGKEQTTVATNLPGLTTSQAMRSASLWKLMLAFLLVAMAANGVITHLVPLLTDRGLDPEVATSTLSMAGLALIGGRLLAGYCLDHLFAPYVAATFFALPLLGLLLLMLSGGTDMATPAVILIALGLGAEVDLIAYLQSRYLGLRSFGELYGYLFAVFMLGSGLGPFLMGMGFQQAGSYDLPLQVLAGCLALACILVLRLGPYRYVPGAGAEPKPVQKEEWAH